MNVSMQKSLTCVQQIIGYNFADTNILWEALQAAGSDVYLIKTRRISSDGNKKMALIGDALAKAAVLESWWRKNESRAKGQGYVDTLLSNINLQRVCEESGISRYINLNPSTQGIVPPRLKSDTIEAIFAAVAEDGAASGRPNALRTDESEAAFVDKTVYPTSSMVCLNVEAQSMSPDTLQKSNKTFWVCEFPLGFRAKNTPIACIIFKDDGHGDLATETLAKVMISDGPKSRVQFGFGYFCRCTPLCGFFWVPLVHRKKYGCIIRMDYLYFF